MWHLQTSWPLFWLWNASLSKCVCVFVRERESVRISVQLMKVNNFIRFVPFKSISDLQLLPPSSASSTTVLTSDQSVCYFNTVWLLCLSLCCVPGCSGCPKAVTQREDSRDVIFQRAACIFSSPLFFFPALNIHFLFADNGCTSHLRWPWKVCQGCFYQGIR